MINPAVDRLLRNRSRHIEFNRHLRNHAQHAAIPLARPGE